MERKVVYLQVLATRNMGDFFIKPSPWEDGGAHVSKPISWKVGDSCHKAHVPLSVEGEVLEGGRGARTKRSGEGVAKFSTCP